MPRIVKFGPNDVNGAKLIEEIQTAGLSPLVHISGYPGYDPVTSRRYTAAPARRQVGETVVNGNRTVIEADPREIWIDTTRDLTAPEDTLLNTTLAAHVYTVLTAEQQRQDVDEADLLLLAGLYTGLGTDANPSGAWASLNATQKTQRLAFTLRKIVRFVARRERGEPIS